MIERGDYRASARARAGGFTLLEVMVAVVVTAIGLLGIAKIQALAYASTTTASVRSLVALQASGLAASMHANRAYWALGGAPVLITITSSGTTSTISDNTLNSTAAGPKDCYSGGAAAPCILPATIAAFDLHTWANALNAPGMLLNLNPVTTIKCPAAPQPITCTIMVTWNEKAVSVNSQGANNTVVANGTAQNGTFQPTYVLYVEP
jgi:type IV pilus assembly protein PilV